MPIDIHLLQRVQELDPTLTEIYLKNQNLTLAEVQKLAGLLRENPYVNKLDLSGNLLGDGCVERCVACPFVRNLNLSGNNISDNALYHFAENNTVIALDLSHNNITDIGLEYFVQNSSITELVLNGNKIIAAGKLAANPKLISLSLKCNQINSEGIRGFIPNVTLKKIYLDDNLLKDEGAILLSQNRHLEEISLDHNQMGKNAAIAFVHTSNAHLSSLSLAYNHIEDEGAAAFKTLTSIKKLILAGNQINSHGIAALAQNSSIEYLDISFNQVDDNCLRALSANKTIGFLNLSHNQITAKGVYFLLAMQQLKTLLLNYNDIGDEGAAILADSHLSYLDLTGNGITSDGAQDLAKNNTIITLMIGINNLSDTGAKALANNKSLRKLVLTYNDISNEGAIAFAKNTSLKELDLNYNSIDEEGYRVLKANPYLEKLHLPLLPIPPYATNRLQLIFTYTQNLFCILSLDGKIHFCNAAFVRTLGYLDHELLEMNLNNLLHPEDRAHNHPLKLMSQKYPALNLDARLICKDGSYRMIRWNSHLRGGYIYSSCTDLTDQKKYEQLYIRLHSQRESDLVRREEAESYSRQQTEFIAHLSHEIRNPLSGEYSITELVEENIEELKKIVDKSDPELMRQKLNSISDYLSDLRACIKHQEDILNDNLDLAKISEKKLVLEERLLDLNNIITDSIRILRTQAEKKGLPLTFTHPDEVVNVKGDPSRIKQVVINLVKNAINWTSKGEVRVILNIIKQTDTTIDVEMTVKDTGIGIPEDKLSNLFTRFSQIATPEYTGHGTGLGLYISKKLVELMGGAITVDSKESQGSTFVVFLPFIKPSPELVSKNELTHPVPLLYNYIFQGKPKVLVVEDNCMNRKLLCNMLREKFICVEAEDGEEALKGFRTHEIDIILMDMLMPNMTGMEATRIIRDEENAQQLPHVPIIAVTANALERDVKAAMMVGMDAYLVKPYKRDKLIPLMLELIGKAKSEEAKSSHHVIPSLTP